MTEEVDFLIQRIRDEYGVSSLPTGTTAVGSEPPLEIVDRDDAEFESGRRSRSGELTQANIVSIASVDDDSTAIGTEYDHSVERICGVRIEGLHHSEWGHIDPDGREGAPWRSLVRIVRRAILRARGYPDPGTPDIGYTDLRLVNGVDQSQNYGDYYRYDVDVIFDGFERLP